MITLPMKVWVCKWTDEETGPLFEPPEEGH